VDLSHAAFDFREVAGFSLQPEGFDLVPAFPRISTLTTEPPTL
jgi:hypothetical protein